MPAFEAAIALGLPLPRDRRPGHRGRRALAFHDDDLSRTCGRPGRISELPWSEVQTARVGGKEPIPLLEDVLGTFPEARINIDAKSDAGGRPADRRHPPHGQLWSGSASARSPTGASVEVRRALGPKLCTSMGPFEVARWLSASFLPGGLGHADGPGGPGAADAGARPGRHRPVGAGGRGDGPPGPRVDDRRRRPRWTGCSTSASRAS